MRENGSRSIVRITLKRIVIENRQAKRFDRNADPRLTCKITLGAKRVAKLIKLQFNRLFLGIYDSI